MAIFFQSAGGYGSLGELPPEEQDRAFAPSRLRKLIVSTYVAETAVTIDVIVHVIDS